MAGQSNDMVCDFFRTGAITFNITKTFSPLYGFRKMLPNLNSIIITILNVKLLQN